MRIIRRNDYTKTAQEAIKLQAQANIEGLKNLNPITFRDYAIKSLTKLGYFTRSTLDRAKYVVRFAVDLWETAVNFAKAGNMPQAYQNFNRANEALGALVEGPLGAEAKKGKITSYKPREEVEDQSEGGRVRSHLENMVAQSALALA